MAIEDLLGNLALRARQRRYGLADIEPGLRAASEAFRSFGEMRLREREMTERNALLQMGHRLREQEILGTAKKNEADLRKEAGKKASVLWGASNVGKPLSEGAATIEEFDPVAAQEAMGRAQVVTGRESAEAEKLEDEAAEKAGYEALSALPPESRTVEAIWGLKLPARVERAAVARLREARLGQSAADLEAARKAAAGLAAEKFEYQKQQDAEQAQLAAARLNIAEEWLRLGLTKENRIAAKQAYDTAIARLEETQQKFWTGGQFGAPRVLDEYAWAKDFPAQAAQLARARAMAAKFEFKEESQAEDPKKARIRELMKKGDARTPEEDQEFLDLTGGR